MTLLSTSLVVALVLLVPRPQFHAEASHEGGTVALMALDMDPTSDVQNVITFPPPGNVEVTTLGTIQSCIEVTHPTSFDIDIVLQGYPSVDDSLVGYDVSVTFPAGLELDDTYDGTGYDAGDPSGSSGKTLISSDPQSGPFASFTDPPVYDSAFDLVDLTGPATWSSAGADLAPKDADENVDGEENSDGHIVKMFFETTGAATGVLLLTLSGETKDDQAGMDMDAVHSGAVAVDTACPIPTDVRMTSVITNSPGSKEVETPFTVTADASVSNNGGQDPVNVDTTIELNLPSDCDTADPNPVIDEDRPVDVAGSPVSLSQKSWTVTCSDPSFHDFTTTAAVVIDDPLAFELNSNNNTDTSPGTTTTITAEADLVVNSVSVDGPSSQAIVNVPFDVEILVDIGDSGPFGATVDLTVTLTLVGDCSTSDPNPQTNPAVPTPILFPLLWSVTCTLVSDHVFSASATVAPSAPSDPHVIDPNGANNSDSGQAIITVSADVDGDGVGDPFDNCPDTANPGQENNVHPGTPEGDHCEDPDTDLVFDITDNCPDTANLGQENIVHPGTPEGDHCEDPDADLVFDITDNCPDTANPDQENNVHPGTPEGDHCEDPDNDGSYDFPEFNMGTDPDDPCPDDSSHDAWPYDTTRNKIVDIDDLLGDPNSFKNSFGSSEGDPNYDPRYDFNADTTIDIDDLLGTGKSFKTSFGTSCGNGTVRIDETGDGPFELTSDEEFHYTFDETYTLSSTWRVEVTVADKDNISFKVACPGSDEHNFDIPFSTGGNNTVTCNDGSKVDVTVN